MGRIKKVINNIYKIPGDATLQDIYQELTDKHLPVEPLSMNQSIEDFILEGGTGFNSLKRGRLGKTICEIKAEYDGKPFKYGLPFTTLFAAGYPLQRIIEGSKNNTFIKKFDKIDYITIPLIEKEELKILWKKSEYQPFTLPSSSLNGFYLNTYSAKLFGLKGEGFCVVLPKDAEEGQEGWELIDETIWSRRFFIDTLDNDEKTMKIFTQMSNVLSISDKFSEITKGAKKSIFFVLYTNLGLLVLISGSLEILDSVWEEIKDLKLTYKLN